MFEIIPNNKTISVTDRSKIKDEEKLSIKFKDLSVRELATYILSLEKRIEALELKQK